MAACVVEPSAYRVYADKMRKGASADDCAALEELCRYNRTNALACIVAAQRGWLGASFSCAEMLTAIYFDPALFQEARGDVVALSKGHAAVMQYACLAGRGTLPTAELLRYEMPDGPQAHTDRQTPGIMINTGSLGQTLSKCIGLAMARPAARIYVILGDGELQEGQNWEAFMAWSKFKLSNLIVIVDCNGIQTDTCVADIMPVPEITAALPGFGIKVLTVDDGNSMGPMHHVLLAAHAEKHPTAILARTHKGAGLSFTSARLVPPRSYVWHGRVPNAAEYSDALKELAGQMLSAAVRDSLLQHCTGLDAKRGATAAGPAAPDAAAARSTGTAFGEALLNLGARYPALRVLDADLEKSCQLTSFATKCTPQFIEVGVAEQNMVSIAGGLALAGLVPVVNTYANFYRRAAEQIYVNATEKTRVVYAGHYAGLCYATDGKTHQSTGDIALFRSIPGVIVVYPTWPEEVSAVLNWYLGDASIQAPLYIRLHRTPALASSSANAFKKFQYGFGTWVRERTISGRAIITAGPHMLEACVSASEMLPAAQRPDIIALSSHTGLNPDFLNNLALRYASLAVIEETFVAGGLFDAVSGGLADLGLKVIVHHQATTGITFSTRDRLGLYKHFGLDKVSLANWLFEIWGPGSLECNC